MSVPTDALLLAHDASLAKFMALTTHQLYATIAYSLAVKNGGSTDAMTLLHQASNAGFAALPEQQLKVLMAYLMMELVNP